MYKNSNINNNINKAKKSTRIATSAGDRDSKDGFEIKEMEAKKKAFSW